MGFEVLDCSSQKFKMAATSMNPDVFRGRPDLPGGGGLEVVAKITFTQRFAYLEQMRYFENHVLSSAHHMFNNDSSVPVFLPQSNTRAASAIYLFLVHGSTCLRSTLHFHPCLARFLRHHVNEAGSRNGDCCRARQCAIRSDGDGASVLEVHAKARLYCTWATPVE